MVPWLPGASLQGRRSPEGPDGLLVLLLASPGYVREKEQDRYRRSQGNGRWQEEAFPVLGVSVRLCQNEMCGWICQGQKQNICLQIPEDRCHVKAPCWADDSHIFLPPSEDDFQGSFSSGDSRRGAGRRWQVGWGTGNDTESSWTLRPERPESNPARPPASCDPSTGSQ